MKYDGFVYIWYDRLRRKFYIGSHKGQLNDAYVGSGIYFRNAYAKRPEMFKRRILEFVVGNPKQIKEREQKWLDLMKNDELGDKYYNVKKCATGGSSAGSKRRGWTLARRKKTIAALTGRPKSFDYRLKLSSVVAMKYTFRNEHTREIFVGSVRDFAIKFFSLEKRPSIANSAYKSKRYKGWVIT